MKTLTLPAIVARARVTAHVIIARAAHARVRVAFIHVATTGWTCGKYIKYVFKFEVQLY